MKRVNYDRVNFDVSDWENSGNLSEGASIQGEEIIFTTTDNETYQMFHSQDCCEYVYLEDVCGDISDLLGVPIALAEEVSSPATNAANDGTWTFYKIATIKGSVTLRWLGTSNGYYSEKVDFVKSDLSINLYSK